MTQFTDTDVRMLYTIAAHMTRDGSPRAAGDLRNLAERITAQMVAGARAKYLTVEEAYAQSDHRHSMDLATFKGLCAANGWRWKRRPATGPLTDEEIHTLRCAVENMRSPEDTESVIEARFRLAYRVEQITIRAATRPKD